MLRTSACLAAAGSTACPLPTPNFRVPPSLAAAGSAAPRIHRPRGRRAGAIHRRAGPQLVALCRAVPEVRPGVRCPTGQAVITGCASRRLPAAQRLGSCPRAVSQLPGLCAEGVRSAARRGADLEARHVIHTVGPVYFDDQESAPLLADAYRCAPASGPLTQTVMQHADASAWVAF